jgi:hypothetical protein
MAPNLALTRRPRRNPAQTRRRPELPRSGCHSGRRDAGPVTGARDAMARVPELRLAVGGCSFHRGHWLLTGQRRGQPARLGRAFRSGSALRRADLSGVVRDDRGEPGSRPPWCGWSGAKECTRTSRCRSFGPRPTVSTSTSRTRAAGPWTSRSKERRGRRSSETWPRGGWRLRPHVRTRRLSTHLRDGPDLVCRR